MVVVVLVVVVVSSWSVAKYTSGAPDEGSLKSPIEF